MEFRIAQKYLWERWSRYLPVFDAAPEADSDAQLLRTRMRQLYASARYPRRDSVGGTTLDVGPFRICIMRVLVHAFVPQCPCATVPLCSHVSVRPAQPVTRLIIKCFVFSQATEAAAEHKVHVNVRCH